MDCSCDPWRCDHGYVTDTGPAPDSLTEPWMHPDLLVNVTLLAVELRWPQVWQTYWFADAGGAVCLAIDDVPEPALPGISVACLRRWLPGVSGPGVHPRPPRQRRRGRRGGTYRPGREPELSPDPALRRAAPR
jgi:hypothetical protein